MSTFNIYQELHKRVLKDNTLSKTEQRSASWFQRYARKIVGTYQAPLKNNLIDVDESTTDTQTVAANAVKPGYLYFFRYTAQDQNNLYDAFPYVLITERTETGFSGLNFHYLSYYHRAILFDLLYQTRYQHRKNTLTARIQISPEVLVQSSKYSLYKACYRSYLYKSCRSSLLQVGHSEWDLALFLPVELFIGATKSVAWRTAYQRVKAR